MFIKYVQPEKVTPKIINRNKEICRLASAGETFTKIASFYDLSKERVRQIVKKRSGATAKDLKKIRMDAKSVYVYYFICNNCHKEFFLFDKNGRKFCTEKCRTDFFLKNMRVDDCVRILSFNGRIRPPKKYALTYTGMSKTKKGKSVYRLAHRVIMEKHIGRKLETWEHVHHMDGNGLNNSIDNLKIVKAGDHARLTIKKSWIPVCKLAKVTLSKSKLVKYKDLQLLK